jgi:hypothetical protein
MPFSLESKWAVGVFQKQFRTVQVVWFLELDTDAQAREMPPVSEKRPSIHSNRRKQALYVPQQPSSENEKTSSFKICCAEFKLSRL